jgi:hypothetical protein
MDIGFLAVIPLIVMVMGLDAVFFVAAVVVVAYLMGAVMRFNIAHLPPTGAEQGLLRRLVPTGSYVLAAAYAINIAYYLQLLAVLALAAFDQSSGLATNLIVTAVLAAIGIVGFIAGIAKLNALGERTVPFNLAIVGAFLVGLVVFNLQELVAGDWALPDIEGKTDTESIRKVLGTLVIVQGFEISLYLGNLYPVELRNRTMRYAQLISALIFVATFALLTVLFDTPTDVEGVGAVIDISAVVSNWLPWILIIGAIGSQLSASVSNTGGGGSLLVETVGPRLQPRYSYQLIVVPAIVLTWLTDVGQVISLASRAFGAYYVVHCLIGIRLRLNQPASASRNWHIVGYAAMAVIMGIIAVFSIPT